MRKSLLATASVLGLAFTLSSGAQAATIVQIPPVPGASNYTVFGITNDNTIAGAYHDTAGVEHGFVGTLDGTYTTFDFTGTGITGTEPRYIAEDGSIPGFAAGSGFQFGEEFFRKPDGSFVVPTIGGNPLDGVIQGTNAHDKTVGDYVGSDGATRIGEKLKVGNYLEDFRLHVKHWARNSPRGITNDHRTYAGLFDDKNLGEHGFIQTDRQVQVIDYPSDSAFGTVLEDINESGQASGQWTDSGGSPHAFVYDSNASTFTDITVDDGSTFQQAWAINEAGLVPFSTSTGVSYLYCPDACPSILHGRTWHVTPHQIRVPAGTTLKYDEYGRTAHKLPPITSIKKKGEIQ
jgi:hypothetical protein